MAPKRASRVEFELRVWRSVSSVFITEHGHPGVAGMTGKEFLEWMMALSIEDNVIRMVEGPLHHSHHFCRGFANGVPIKLHHTAFDSLQALEGKMNGPLETRKNRPSLRWRVDLVVNMYRDYERAQGADQVPTAANAAGQSRGFPAEDGHPGQGFTGTDSPCPRNVRGCLTAPHAGLPG